MTVGIKETAEDAAWLRGAGVKAAIARVRGGLVDQVRSILKGSSTSGNWGHRGVAGQYGGSAPGGGLSKLGIAPGAPREDVQAAVDQAREARKPEVKEATEEMLLNNRLLPMEDADYAPGVTESYVVQVEGDGKAIVKPDASQANKWFKYDTTVQERAAYDVSQRMGFEDLVPPTVQTEFEGQTVSAQAWVEGGQLALDMDPSQWEDIDQDSFRQMLVFDAVMGNKDRHWGNFLVMPDGKVKCIDHGAMFYTPRAGEGGIFGKAWAFHGDFRAQVMKGQWVRPRDVEPVRALLNDAGLESYIKGRLGTGAWNGMKRRMQALVDNYGE